MRWIVVVLGLLFGQAFVRAQIPVNIFSRVFQLRVGGSTGTTFLLDYEDRQYFVTANHMVAHIAGQTKVDILNAADSQWRSIGVRVLNGQTQCDDVAVLVPDEKRISEVETVPFMDNFIFGQEAYFLGFPYGLITTFLTDKRSVPLVKHAYVSGSVRCSAIYPNVTSDHNIMLLDGLNNPGFSGGPVIVPDGGASGRVLKIIGVISGYKNENRAISVNGQDAINATVATNSGIILAIPILRAIDLIKTDRQKQTGKNAK